MRALQHDERNSGLPQRGTHRESAWRGSDDDGVEFSRHGRFQHVELMVARRAVTGLYMM